ncbi:MAG: SAM-dependent methyltransferase [Hyphomicrobium sp.]|jgi:NADH dehydrogenase [ubiquinone] 1 alpha subcomplex assembly factor 7|uniref:class I SAM-dependent methyltransferase n=1 Tax=Hyphomicrobium sp. TaxID=82 RepID=UPI0025BDCC45|nr:SAM-dependent methyltransferase [Hyphomicrobium sp.]MBX9863216.1 SAM-dependent methyltransferase [Hyphomicrobium sp.]
MTEAPRSETALGAKIKTLIRRDGPMSVAGFMAACLTDPEHGYYRRRPAIGAGGDFVTAPEISQVFGELIGLWCAVVWQQMGSPKRLNLVELGPGRGTLMRDALRAARIVPGFRDALDVHLVDRNETLRDLQQAALADCGVALHFHADACDALLLPSRIASEPTLVLANEFLDAMPVEQVQFAGGAWRRRLVVLDAAQAGLCFEPDLRSVVEPHPAPDTLRPAEGDIFEFSPAIDALASALRTRAGFAPLAALFIDYGHAASGFGDTLQGVAGHRYASPLDAPGETDLSAQVDFQSFAGRCQGAGLAVDGPVPQAEFLGRLGIVERASRLMSVNPDKAGAVEAGVQRLLAPTGMGARFLALGVRSAELAPLPGLA